MRLGSVAGHRLTYAGVTVVQVSIGSEPAFEPPLSVLPDTSGPGFAWMALACGDLLVGGGILVRRIIGR